MYSKQEIIELVDRDSRRTLGVGINRELLTQLLDDTVLYEQLRDAPTIERYLESISLPILFYPEYLIRRQLELLDMPKSEQEGKAKTIVDLAFKSFLELNLPVDTLEDKKILFIAVFGRPVKTAWLIIDYMRSGYNGIGKNVVMFSNPIMRADDNYVKDIILETREKATNWPKKLVEYEKMRELNLYIRQVTHIVLSLAKKLVNMYGLVGRYSDVRDTSLLPCLGLRVWTLSFDKSHLESIFHSVIWSSKTMHAESYDDKTGKVRNTPGIHWYWGLNTKKLAQLITYMTRSSIEVIGFGSAYGQVCFGKEGGRSEYFTILALIARTEEIAKNLLKTYPTIAVFSLDNFI
jgi:hypothetical protein